MTPDPFSELRISKATPARVKEGGYNSIWGSTAQIRAIRRVSKLFDSLWDVGLYLRNSEVVR
jgi:hypothetical protein